MSDSSGSGSSSSRPIVITIEIPAPWLGRNPRKDAALKSRILEGLSGIDMWEWIRRWNNGSSLKSHLARVNGFTQTTKLSIIVSEKDFTALAGAAAMLGKFSFELMLGLAGEIEESLSTWERVEAAKAAPPPPASKQAPSDGAVARKGLKTRPKPPAVILPGDKVIFTDQKISRADAARFSSDPWSWRHTRAAKPAVQSVRKTSLDPITGELLVHLVGCYGVATDGGPEPGFKAGCFRKVSDSRGIVLLGDSDVIEVPVQVSPGIARRLEGFVLFPQVEAVHQWANDDQLDSVCRRWKGKWRQSKTIQDAAATVRSEIQQHGSVGLCVPLSALGWQNLEEVCRRLEIEPEEWLQGVLCNRAIRCRKMQDAYEMGLRNEHKGKK